MKKSSKQNYIIKNGRKISWGHPGGKLLRLGPEHCTDDELLAIIISSGAPGYPAETIAKDILKKYQSFKGMVNRPLEEFYKIKGLKQVKIIRIAAAFEMAKRIVDQVLKEKDG
jgi:DNA repair protein RadC